MRRDAVVRLKGGATVVPVRNTNEITDDAGERGLLQLIVPQAFLLADPDPSARAVSELVYGEAVRLEETKAGFAFVVAARDNYAGWVDAASIADITSAGTDRIWVPAAPVRAAPDIKDPVLFTLPLSADVAVTERHDQWLKLADGNWISTTHARPIKESAEDPVALAETLFAGTPYVWGGKTPQGCDCSGMLQTCLLLCGITVPRDSGPQLEVMSLMEEAEIDGSKRGLIAGFAGHIGFMNDDTHLIHANATACSVSIDPLSEVIEIVRKSDGPNSYRGLFRLQPV